MIFVHGTRLAKELQDAMGITRPIRSIAIKADCKDAASVMVEFVVSPEEVEAIGAVTKRYRLVEAE